MDSIQFDQYLGLLFKSQGYQTEVTRTSGDFGADLILHKNGTKIVVQAKPSATLKTLGSMQFSKSSEQ
ncbi:restriction endonuclease [Brevibacillus sp. FIR094]|uniref:restriction endonuclease n=1 Tax=Brevibacillus sp. FIR094 TaxID=3134809 RepID=UPI003D1F071F